MKKQLFILLAVLATTFASGQVIPDFVPTVTGQTWVARATPPPFGIIGQKYLDTDGLYYRYDGSSWIFDILPQTLTIVGDQLSISRGNSVTLPTTGGSAFDPTADQYISGAWRFGLPTSQTANRDVEIGTASANSMWVDGTLLVPRLATEPALSTAGIYFNTTSQKFYLGGEFAWIDPLLETGTAAEITYDNTTTSLPDNVQGAIDEINTLLDELKEYRDNDGFYYTQTFSTDQTITSEMARPTITPNKGKRGKLIFTGNNTATLSNDLPLDYSFVVLPDETADSLMVVPSGGGLLYGELNNIEFKVETVDAVSVKVGRSLIVTRTATDQYNVEGNADAISLVPPINNIYTEDNIISEDVETDSFGTITMNTSASSSATAITKPATGGQDGGRYLHIEGSTDNTSDRLEIPWSGAVVGDIIEVSYYVRIDANLGQRAAAVTGLTEVGGAAFIQDFYTSETTWTKIIYTLEASATSGLWRIYNGGDGNFDIDSFVMDNQGQ